MNLLVVVAVIKKGMNPGGGCGCNQERDEPPQGGGGCGCNKVPPRRRPPPRGPPRGSGCPCSRSKRSTDSTDCKCSEKKE
ncbi:hypothetical protein AVEN_155852-1 [Araneus ventricosus]|uniref:Uncharacterized protein n=1 Tax=Araneus ventricosus TaxID=182803 RepID=A0A4Y2VAS5_ARAVE|nr:hypothetical protein AVEN_155852-1 [Araneus ventricosus]